MSLHFPRFLLLALPLCGAPVPAAHAAVGNPDLSAVGQLRAAATDDAASPDRNRPGLALGESEFILSAALNPYFNGWFTLAADEEGLGVEEAYATMVRGLPWGLGLKAGRYRLGFGKLNALHPHSYPFLDPPRAWVSLLPGGEEGFTEAAFQVSMLLPTPGDWASTLSADVLQGRSFHPGDERARTGWLGRWSHAFLLGDGGALEAGVSGATGIDDVDTRSRGFLLGADAKARFALPGAASLIVQAEGALRRSHLVDTATGTATGADRSGFFAFADYRPAARWNAGVLYEQWDREEGLPAIDRAARVFAGYAVMEETTLFRVALERFLPAAGPAVHGVSAQLLFSMGPHKAHRF